MPRGIETVGHARFIVSTVQGILCGLQGSSGISCPGVRECMEIWDLGPGPETQQAVAVSFEVASLDHVAVLARNGLEFLSCQSLFTSPVLMICSTHMKVLTTSMDSSCANTIRAMMVGVLGLFYGLAVKEFKLSFHRMS